MKLHCLNVTADGEPTAISPWPKISAVFSMPLSMSLTSFSEYKDTKPRKTPVWFALNKDRPLAAFAGIWRPWTGVRGTKAEPVEGEHLAEFPHLGAERRRRADPSQGYAGDPDDPGGL